MFVLGFFSKQNSQEANSQRSTFVRTEIKNESFINSAFPRQSAFDWKHKQLQNWHFPQSDHTFGKGEVESSNLSGSTIKTSMKSITC